MWRYKALKSLSRCFGTASSFGRSLGRRSEMCPAKARLKESIPKDRTGEDTPPEKAAPNGRM